MPSAPLLCSTARAATVLVALALGSALPTTVGFTQSSSASSPKASGLDMLFAQLKAANDEHEAGKIEAKISELLSQSNRPEINELFTKAGQLIIELRFAAALSVLHEIVQLAPDWAEGWNTRATVHYLVESFDLALADTERALALEPRHFYALRTMGACRLRKAEYGAALAAYRKALIIHPFLNDRLDVIPDLEKKLGAKPY
jgi:tetratricopeptide (TPR) repeat protein